MAQEPQRANYCTQDDAVDCWNTRCQPCQQQQQQEEDEEDQKD